MGSSPSVCVDGQSRGRSRLVEFLSRYWAVVIVGCVCVFVSWAVYTSFVRAAESERLRASVNHAKRMNNEIVNRFEGYEQAMLFMRGFIQSSNHVDRFEWGRFVESSELESQYPGVWGFAYVERVQVGDMDRLVSEMRSQGLLNFSIRSHRGLNGESQGRRDGDRYIVKFEEPAERNVGVVGLDVSTVSVNRAVYEQSADSGLARLSSPLRLAQHGDGGEEIGLVMALPHYLSGMPTSTVEERRKAVRGWVVIVLDMNYFAQNAITRYAETERLMLNMIDVEGKSTTLLDTTMDGHDPCNQCEESDSDFANSFAQMLGGRELQTVVVSDPSHMDGSLTLAEFHDNIRKADIALYLGIKLTALVVVLTLFITYGRVRAFKIAGRMTSSLRRSEQRQREFAYHAQLANRAKSMFLANMSHEIRTPMTAVLGYTELLSEMVPGHQHPEEMRTAVDRIDRAGSHLLMVVNDVLDLSKIESGKLPINLVPCLIGEVLSEVLGTMRVRADEHGLGLDVDFQTRIPERIVTDPYRVRQILLNLLSNAIKFTEHGGVTIGVGCNEKRIWFAVHDTGVGMRSDRMEGLFMPFEQEEGTHDFSNAGTGLGLSISRQLSEMMGGELQATSSLGEGSVFTCTLPLEVPAGGQGDENGVQMIDQLPCSRSSELQAPVLLTKMSGRVLVAEDGPDNQKLLKHFLDRAGVDVVFVWNGQEALDAVEGDGEFDLIIMDMQMPVMEGYEAAQVLRDRGCVIPILALTANAMSGDRQKCLECGCDEYETKPLNRARLLRTIERMIDIGRSSRELAA